jgi:hypothetical protein
MMVQQPAKLYTVSKVHYDIVEGYLLGLLNFSPPPPKQAQP